MLDWVDEVTGDVWKESWRREWDSIWPLSGSLKTNCLIGFRAVLIRLCALLHGLIIEAYVRLCK